MNMTERDRCVMPHIPEDVCGVRIAAVWDVLANSSYSCPISKSLQDSRHSPDEDCRNKIIIRTREGQGGVDLQDGESFALTPHTLFITDLHQISKYYADSQSWSFWWFDICCAVDLKVSENEVLHCPVQESEYEQVEAVELNLESRRPAGVQLATASLISWLYDCWDRCMKNRDQSPQEKIVEAVVDLMYQRLTGNLSVKEMAAAVGLSLPQLRSAFKQVHDSNPKAYYESLRLRTARNRLKLGAFSVAEVAEQLGYCDQFHFSKVFQKQFGVLPSRV
jgi:AraC-like DNA-binding protein